MRQDPGKVFKGKKMPGHMGNKQARVCVRVCVCVCRLCACIRAFGTWEIRKGLSACARLRVCPCRACTRTAGIRETSRRARACARADFARVGCMGISWRGVRVQATSSQGHLRPGVKLWVVLLFGIFFLFQIGALFCGPCGHCCSAFSPVIRPLDSQATVENLRVYKVDVTANLVMVEGAVPGDPSHARSRTPKRLRTLKRMHATCRRVCTQWHEQVRVAVSSSSAMR
jgi:hypothetical protein